MIEVGKWNKLNVLRIKDFGIYLGDKKDNAQGSGVLLPKKKVPENIKIGDCLDVFIYRDSSDRLIATTDTPYITMNEIKRLEVKSVTNIGAFMDWGLEKDIFLPFKEQTAKVIEGKEYLVRMYTDKSNRLCVSMKLYDYLAPIEGYENGDSFSGIIYEYKQGMGAFVAIDDKYSGLIHENEIYNKVYVGDEVEGRIVSIREDGRADLALKNVSYKQMIPDSEMVYDVIKSYKGVLPFNDKADKELIKKELGMSKNAFKRAVGRLLKEGKIKITEKTIELRRK